ncbi:MAG: hypothetical protein IJZ89_02585, partial [Clostridia bacterium]|nr:hypothetical protein [Clostridia bacterium]
MKKSLACITAVVILIFLVSCSEETPIDPYASLPQLQNVEYSISSEVIDVAIDDNEFILYLLYNDRITAFDLAKGSEELYCETDDNDLISTANNKIYTYSGKDDLIRIFDNNELTKEIKCNFNASELRRIYVHGNHFLLETMDGGKYNPESNIYYADLESGENHIIDPKKFKKSDTVIINSIGFEDDDTVIILASTNQSLTNTVKKIIRFNIVSQKLIEKKKIDCITNIREYYPWDKCFYGEDNCQISLYSPENDETTNLGFRHDYEYKGKLNIGNSVYTSRMMIAGTNAIIWDGYIDHKIVVTNFSEKDPVVINLPMNFFDHKLVAERYKEKFGGNVHFTIYQNFESDKDLELYYDKVRLSLLAKDSEVDIFFISNQSDMYFLDSLLNNGAYTPLEDYEAIDKGFDNLMSGVRDIMSYEGHIYAVPLNIELYWNSVKTDYAKELGFDKFDRSSLTYDDIWTACEKLRAFDTDKISLFYNARLDEFLIPFVQNAIDSGELNEAELT